MSAASLLTVAVERATVAIIGVGNVLMRDDAFGPAMIRRLEAARGDGPGLLQGVELVDAGTAGFDLMHQLLGRARVLLLDTVAARQGEAPGTVLVYTHDELMAMRRQAPRGSPHEPGVLAALQVADLAGALPRVTLLGVVPHDEGLGEGLTPTVAATPTRRAASPPEAGRTCCCA